nr:prenyltransferase/squalene oxidase repeat-containing protein [Hyphomonas sp. Mor2]
MDGSFASETLLEVIDLKPAIQRILNIQSDDGAIAWFEQGPWDSWNHVESAMALCVLGEYEAAERAYDYLASSQRPDGAWLGEYGNALPMVDRDYISREPAPAVLDSNFCAYPAVGVAHYLKRTGRIERVQTWWPMVARALDFVISLQLPNGTICWAKEALGNDAEDALLAGNASILKSIECGLYLAKELGHTRTDWAQAHAALLQALRTDPSAFDRRGHGRRFAMDWYYPVLSHALSPDQALDRILGRWSVFVPELGCRCVSDEPWVTTAETAELVLTLIAIGDLDRAVSLFQSLSGLRDENGAFWMGWQSEEMTFWPKERPSWTQAAVVLAADALTNSTPASRVLVEPLL